MYNDGNFLSNAIKTEYHLRTELFPWVSDCRRYGTPDLTTVRCKIQFLITNDKFRRYLLRLLGFYRVVTTWIIPRQETLPLYIIQVSTNIFGLVMYITLISLTHWVFRRILVYFLKTYYTSRSNSYKNL